jgi:hypothetical protein
MPRNDEKKQGKKNVRRSKDDDDSSQDSKGNLRNLIDYDYTESSSEEMFKMECNERPPRKAKTIAKKKIRKELGLPSDSSESLKQRKKKKAEDDDDKVKKRRGKPVLIVESESEEEETE